MSQDGRHPCPIYFPHDFKTPISMVSISRDLLLVADQTKIYSVNLCSVPSSRPLCALWAGQYAADQRQQQAGQQANSSSSSSRVQLEAIFPKICAIGYSKGEHALYVAGGKSEIHVLPILRHGRAGTISSFNLSQEHDSLFSEKQQLKAMLVHPGTSWSACDDEGSSSQSSSSSSSRVRSVPPRLLLASNNTLMSVGLSPRGLGSSTQDPWDSRTAVGDQELAFVGLQILAADSRGVVYASDMIRHCVWRIQPGGEGCKPAVTTWVGVPGFSGGSSGMPGPGPEMKLYRPTSLCVDGQDNIYIANGTPNCIVKADPVAYTSQIVQPEVNEVKGGVAICLEVTRQGQLAVLWSCNHQSVARFILCLYTLGLKPQLSRGSKPQHAVLGQDLGALFTSGRLADLQIQV